MSTQRIIGLDPGSCESALVRPDREGTGWMFFTIQNQRLVEQVRSGWLLDGLLVIEQVKCYGNPVGDDVLWTVFWSGRIAEACLHSGGRVALLPRKTIVTTLCGNPRARDSIVHQRLVDIYGPKGTKKDRGRLYGIKNDEWSALAVATAAREIGEKGLTLL